MTGEMEKRMEGEVKKQKRKKVIKNLIEEAIQVLIVNLGKDPNKKKEDEINKNSIYSLIQMLPQNHHNNILCRSLNKKNKNQCKNHGQKHIADP